MNDGGGGGGGGDESDHVVHSGYLTLVDRGGGGGGGGSEEDDSARFYCHYEGKGKLFCMISYNQVCQLRVGRQAFLGGSEEGRGLTNQGVRFVGHISGSWE